MLYGFYIMVKLSGFFFSNRNSFSIKMEPHYLEKNYIETWELKVGLNTFVGFIL